MMLMLIWLLMQVLMMMTVLTLMALITMTVRFLFLRWMEWAVTLSARSGLSVLRNLSRSLSLTHTATFDAQYVRSALYKHRRDLAELAHQWHVAGRKKLRCNRQSKYEAHWDNTPPVRNKLYSFAA